ncbi:MAG: TlpA disulfide reductase family protein [Cytophagales bacterium]|nr:TlpA disulfide reductase family protein [Cytophagales bacterium]
MWLLLVSYWLPLSCYSQQVTVVNIEQVTDLMQNQSDTVYVVNFWATWCAPCVKELPEFVQLHEAYQNRKVRVQLISIDFRSALESSLKPLLQRKNITCPVWLLNNTDYDSWINRIEESWQGEIPFTLIFNNQRRKRVVISGQTDFHHLEKLIGEML